MNPVIIIAIVLVILVAVVFTVVIIVTSNLDDESIERTIPEISEVVPPDAIEQEIKTDEEFNEVQVKETIDENFEVVECLDSGGKWLVSDGLHVMKSFCNLPTSDGGKECTDSSQCESWCEAKKGAESLSHDNIGTCYEKQFSTCGNEVKDGVVKGMICY